MCTGKNLLNLQFVKVRSHTGVIEYDRAETLAKLGCKIFDNSLRDIGIKIIQVKAINCFWMNYLICPSLLKLSAINRLIFKIYNIL